MISPAKCSDLDSFFFFFPFSECYCNRICSDEKRKKKKWKKKPSENVQLLKMKLKLGLQEWYPILFCPWSQLLFFSTTQINTTFLSGAKTPGWQNPLHFVSWKMSGNYFLFVSEWKHDFSKYFIEIFYWERKRQVLHPLWWYEAGKGHICKAETSRSRAELYLHLPLQLLASTYFIQSNDRMKLFFPVSYYRPVMHLAGSFHLFPQHPYPFCPSLLQFVLGCFLNWSILSSCGHCPLLNFPIKVAYFPLWVYAYRALIFSTA